MYLKFNIKFLILPVNEQNNEYFKRMENLNLMENIEQESQCDMMEMIDLDCKLYFIQVLCTFVVKQSTLTITFSCNLKQINNTAFDHLI